MRMRGNGNVGFWLTVTDHATLSHEICAAVVDCGSWTSETDHDDAYVAMNDYDMTCCGYVRDHTCPNHDLENEALPLYS